MSSTNDATEDAMLTVTVASKVSFTELCGLLEKISKTTGNDKKKKVLKDFVQKWRDFHDELHSKSNDTVRYVI